MEPTKDSFPAGLRVLVVDDDPICLLILEKLLRRCAYEVTTCEKATVALAMLREKKSRFDLVISDVYMPDMDGFKLLELVGLEMDLPVIMMSADGETSAVMKGITHGACDYLLKPVRIEELRNIWQHVLRKRRCEAKDSELSVSVEVVEDTEHMCPSNSKKRKDMKEDEDEDDDNDHEADDSTALKKPRVVWSVELHQQFVSAVNQLGIDKAVPKRILELMGVQGLTRENVASHLQKYRLFLKRLSIAPYKSAIDLPFAGGQESSTIRHMGSLDRLNDLHSLATSGQLSTQALAPVHSAMLSRLGNINGVGPGPLDNSLWLQLAALQGSNYGYLSRPMLQTPWLNSQGNILQAISGEVELDQLAQTRQSLGQQGPSGDNLAETNVLQHRISLKGEAGMKTTESIVDSGFDSSSGTALMAHLLQQQQQKQHAQIRTAAGANLPLGACSGQSILSVETSNHVGRLPKAGSITSSFNSQGGSLGVDSSSMVSNGCLGDRDPAASHGLGSHRLISSVGSKSQTLLHVVDDFQIANGADANFQKAAPTAIAASAVMETGTNLVYVNDNYNTQVNRVSMQNFSAVGNLSSSIRPTSRQPKITGWQGQNSSVNQNLGQVPHFLEIPFYGQLLNENENTSTVSGPSEKDFLELTGADFNLPKDAEVSYFGPSTGACAKRDHATTESFHISKEQWSVDSADTKLESSASIFGDSSSDDLVTLILKQQEGMMGFTENDSALDGFAAEICM